MHKAFKPFAIGCLGLALSSHALAQGYNKPFKDVTTDPAAGQGMLNPGSPVREDATADIDMQRASKAFNAGESEATDTVLYRTYDPYSSIAVRTRKYMTTLISIPENRKIKEIIGADPRGFQVQHMGSNSPNQIAVTPMAYDIDTNLVVTDFEDNIYTFYLRSEPLKSKYVPHFAVVLVDNDKLANMIIRFDENNNPISPVEDFTQKDGKPEANTAEGKLPNSNKLSKKEYDFLRELDASGVVNVNYRMFGERSIAPNAVWDDGHQTYISFRDGTPSQRIPNVYRLVDGYGVIANYHYSDGFIVVDAISDEGWMLVDGTKTVCIKAPDYDERKSMEVHIKEVIENEAATHSDI